MIRSLYSLPDCSLLTWSNSVLKENITEKQNVTECYSSGALMKDWMPCEMKFLGCRPYICICMYIYVCIHVYMGVCVCICMRMCMCMYIYIYFFLYM